MYRRRQITIRIAILLILVSSLFFFSFNMLAKSESSERRELVEKFYLFEQDGNYSESWKLFHPYMKEKFPKASFIQDRAHVFNGHFGSETFTFEVGEPEEITGWKPANDEKTFKPAYKFKVIQNYSGKYGRFSFVQDVFVVKYKSEWVILWDYNK